MTIALLATGDELVDGDTLNTSHQAIAAAIASDGLALGLHITCRDRVKAMVECLRFLSTDHDTIVITGGLGPTSDDLTRFALAEFLEVALVVNPEALSHIQERLDRAHLMMNEGNRQQALFPAEAILLENPCGTAMGCYFLTDNKRFFLLPGPPSECMPMFYKSVLPILHLMKHRDQALLKWRFFGISESHIAETLEPLLSNLDCDIGYRLEIPYVEFKVRCAPMLLPHIKQMVDPFAARFVISPVDMRASECLRRKLDELDQRITILDHVTGGFLQTLLQHPTNYKTVSFQQTEREDLIFHLTGLDEYWSQKPSSGKTELQIDYQVNGKHHQVSHQIPYFNPQVVISFASEWLSFQLLNIINQIEPVISILYCRDPE